MTAIAPTNDARATEFAEAVRSNLADLPAEDLDDLLDGLQADLTDRLADGGELGDPVAYADELRLAAGLPPRGAGKKPKRKLRQSIADDWRGAGQRLTAFWDATPGRRAIRDFAVSLRPVWWFVRGLVLAWAVLVVGGGLGLRLVGLFAVIAVLALVIVSVQWGRGAWAPTRLLVALRRIANAIAVILVLPAFFSTLAYATTPQYIQEEAWMPEGLSLNGNQISNIFAFDCLGQPIDVVQLYDQRGEPITTRSEWGPIWGFDEETQQNIIYAQSEFAEFAGLWNAFPLNEAREDDLGLDEEALRKKAKSATWPHDESQPLSAACKTEREAGAEGDGGAEGSDEAASDEDQGAAGTSATASAADTTGTDATGTETTGIESEPVQP